MRYSGSYACNLSDRLRSVGRYRSMCGFCFGNILLYLFTRKRTRKYAAIIAAAVFALVILSVCGRDRIFTDDGYYLEAVSINDNRIELTADGADLYIEDGKLYNEESLTQENFPGDYT